MTKFSWRRLLFWHCYCFSHVVNSQKVKVVMKRQILLWSAAGVFGFLVLLFSGCYTQLSTVRDTGGESDEYQPAAQEGDTTYANEGDSGEYYEGDHSWDNNGYYYPPVGMYYYYPSVFWPSVAFSFAYGNPWYDPYFYDPWYYGYGYGGYYGYGYGYRYHYPYYYGGYYSPYYNGYYGSPVTRGTRVFGSTRGTTARGAMDTRGTVQTTGGSGYQLPTAGSIGRGTGSSSVNRSTGTTNTVRQRQSGTQRSVSPANRGNTRVYRRDAAPQRSPREGYRAPSRPASREYRGSRESAPSRSPAPSYRPAPSRAPSAPPPSGGGGSRGGGSRGGRR